MIHVIAHITAKPGKRSVILDFFRANMQAVHAEEGCLEYTPVIDAAGFEKFATPLGEDSFIVVEKWATDDDLKAHAAAPHMAAYGQNTKDLIASRAVYVLAAT